MSDSTLNEIIRYGTQAERLAFTPDPATGSQVLYIWYETDNSPDTYVWDGSVSPAAWVHVNGGGSGNFVQRVNTQTGAVATGTTVIPLDDTIPQNTEGDEYMTRAITPTSATNILYIDVEAFATVVGTNWMILALFQDATAGALATTAELAAFSTSGGALKLRYKMTAGTTSATTFKVRIGPNTATTVTFNGQSGARLFGGSLASSITITEVTP